MQMTDRTRPIRLAALGALLLAPAVAMAAGETSSTEAVEKVMGMILSNTSSLLTNSPFAAQGAWLLNVLLLILISWKGLKLMLDVSSLSQVVAEIVNIVLLFGIASFFLTANVQTQFADGFDKLASMAANATGAQQSIDMAKPTQAIANTLGRMMHVAMQLWDGAPADPPANADATQWQKITDWMQKSWDSLTSGQLLGALAAVIFRIFMALAVLVTALIYVAALIFSQILVVIGLIVAPLFVPWILWDATNFLFNSWLKFMIVAGVQKIVGALLFGLTASMVGEVTKLASDATSNGGINFYYYAAAFLIVALMAYLMMQSVSIANGLVSGMPSTAFKPPQAMTPGGSANRVSGGMQSAGTNVARGAASAWRSATGAPPKAPPSSGGGAASASSGGSGSSGGGRPPAALPSSPSGGKGTP